MYNRKLYYNCFDWDRTSPFGLIVMSIISETKKQILGEIQYNPNHGYALSQNLGLPLSFIYQHLKELREAGLIKVEEKERKKIYHLTEKGKMLLKALE